MRIWIYFQEGTLHPPTKMIETLLEKASTLPRTLQRPRWAVANSHLLREITSFKVLFQPGEVRVSKAVPGHSQAKQPHRYRFDQARPRTRFYSYRYRYASARCFVITQRFGTKDKGFQEAGRHCQTGRVQGSSERYRSHAKAQNHCLLNVNSIPDVHRPPHEPWKGYLFRLPADILFYLRSPRSVPIT